MTGTLIGATIGVAGGVVNTHLQARDEDERQASQFAETRSTRLRDERRAAYADFSTSAYRSFGASMEAAIAAGVRDSLSRRDRIRTISEATTAFSRVDDAYAPLLFVASPEVERAATAYRESLRQVFLKATEALVKGTAVPLVDALAQDLQRLGQRYLVAVRLDLGFGPTK